MSDITMFTCSIAQFLELALQQMQRITILN